MTKARFITLTDKNMKYTYNTSKSTCKIDPTKIKTNKAQTLKTVTI